MEKIIDRHIRDNILKGKPLHWAQFAYQLGKSTISALQNLVRRIKKTFVDKEYVMGAFIDIAGAFDNISHESIKAALIRKGVDINKSAWISSMLSDRRIETTLNDFVTEEWLGEPAGANF